MKYLALTLLVFNSLLSFANYSAYEIAEEADRRYSGYQDSTANMEMILIDKNGETDSRKLLVKNIENTHLNTEKTLMIFKSPLDVKGTALLTWSEDGLADKQWVYLPAIKRVKAISSSNKSGAFMGSEFTYEDLSPLDIDKYSYKYIGHEKINSEDCFVYERQPKEIDSGYSKHKLWVDKSEYRIQKIQYYDRKGDHVKTLSFKNYNFHSAKFWRPSSMHMINLQTGKATTLEFNNYEFSSGLTDFDFSRTILKSN